MAVHFNKVEGDGFPHEDPAADQDGLSQQVPQKRCQVPWFTDDIGCQAGEGNRQIFEGLPACAPDMGLGNKAGMLVKTAQAFAALLFRLCGLGLILDFD